jgi:maltose/moltooligosaccharide transporter
MLASKSTPPSETASVIHPSHVYKVGSLTYDRRSLGVLFAWLLWGDFAFNFFEQIFGKFLPLYLNDLKASNVLIGITTGSIAGVVNILFLPNISQWSDRIRTRFGRRIPLLTIVAPLTSLSLLGVGFAPEIATWIQKHVTSFLAPTLTTTTLILSFICVFTISFHFFNMVLVNAYNWLLRDVVPQALMARFLSWFRIVGNVAAVLFLWYVFPTMMTHREITFLCIAIFYIVAFMLMCFNVKEGTYPDPEPHDEGSNLFIRFGTYFKDCLSHPMYRNFFIAWVLVTVAGGCSGPFMTLYTRNDLLLTMDEMGHYAAYTTILGIIMLVPAGWLCDRFSAMKVALICLCIMVVTPLLGYIFISSKHSYLTYALLSTIPGVFWGLSGVALSMSLFPDRVFGQFSAGMNVFGCGGLIFGNYLAGLFMDLVHSDFKMIFFWQLAFYLFALLPMFLVYRDWKRYGGAKNYVAPIPEHMLKD